MSPLLAGVIPLYNGTIPVVMDHVAHDAIYLGPQILDAQLFKCNKKTISLVLTISFNSLAPRRFQFNFRKVIFKLDLVNGGRGISYEIALRWMPQDLTDNKSTLLQVMAWCRQARSHYLSQCWPRSMSPYGITRLQWVNVHNKCTDIMLRASF